MITKDINTVDTYKKDMLNRQYINQVIDEVMKRYNYEQIKTSISSSEKETIKNVKKPINTKNNNQNILYDNNFQNLIEISQDCIKNNPKLSLNEPVKYYYNNLTYQNYKDSLCELTQFGGLILNGNETIIDAELISLAFNLLKILGFKSLKVKINNLGNKKTHTTYLNALEEFENQDKSDNQIPLLTDFLIEEDKNRFLDVENYLDVLDISYENDDKITSNLKECCYTIFEIITTNDGQDTVLTRGSRYELTENKNNLTGIGFNCIIENILTSLEKEDIKLPINNELDIYVAYNNKTEKEYALALTQDLRINSFKVEMTLNETNLEKQLDKAHQLNAKFTIILKDEDLVAGLIQVKDNLTNEITSIKEGEIDDYLDLNLRW